MLALRLKGGLGNQLFQYAAARQLALSNGQPLALDTHTGFARDPYRRSYELSHFAVTAPELSAATVDALRRRCRLRWLGVRHLDSFWRERLRNCYCPLLARIRFTDLYLEGYFQSPRYFTEIEHLVRREFRLGPAAGNHAGQVTIASNCVAIHLRRDRYSNTCPTSYYQQAAITVKTISGEEPHFLVFSDTHQVDPDIVRLPGRVSLIRHQGLNAHLEDFRLMTQCRHFIIANSTYSWWAAWLGSQPGSVVVAPRSGWYGFRNPPRGLLPATWILL